MNDFLVNLNFVQRCKITMSGFLTDEIKSKILEKICLQLFHIKWRKNWRSQKM
jgi:hypothetical protein